MNNKKRVIVECLKAWYTVDSILLNNHAKNHFIKESDYKEYISSKAALLTTLFEYYTHIGFVPKDGSDFKSSKILQESAVTIAKTSKASAAQMLKKPEFKSYMKDYIVKESAQRQIKDHEKFAESVITERFLRMSMDNALLGLPLLESKSKVKESDFKSQILEESYRMLRTSLILLSKTAPKR